MYARQREPGSRACSSASIAPRTCYCNWGIPPWRCATAWTWLRCARPSTADPSAPTARPDAVAILYAQHVASEQGDADPERSERLRLPRLRMSRPRSRHTSQRSPSAASRATAPTRDTRDAFGTGRHGRHLARAAAEVPVEGGHPAGEAIAALAASRRSCQRGRGAARGDQRRSTRYEFVLASLHRSPRRSTPHVPSSSMVLSRGIWAMTGTSGTRLSQPARRVPGGGWSRCRDECRAYGTSASWKPGSCRRKMYLRAWARACPAPRS